jgi:hypothetical protein
MAMAEFVTRFRGRVTAVTAADMSEAAVRTVQTWLIDRSDSDRGRSYDVEVAEVTGELIPVAEAARILNDHGVRYVVDVAAKRGRGSVTARPAQ